MKLMTKKRNRKAYMKAYRKAHNEEIKAYRKAHNEEIKAYQKAYRKAHKDELRVDTNSQGISKHTIRARSSRYLFKVIQHTKLKGYEIHHCFSYEDHRNFIYIPKELHLQIHQYLCDNSIDAESCHYNQIAHLVVAWNGYVFIKA